MGATTTAPCPVGTATATTPPTTATTAGIIIAAAFTTLDFAPYFNWARKLCRRENY